MTLLTPRTMSAMDKVFRAAGEEVWWADREGGVCCGRPLKLAGETIGMVNLIAGQDVSRSSLLYSFSKLQEFFGSLYLKVVLVVSAICAIIYVAWVLLNSPRTRHSSKKVHRYGRPRD